MLKHPFFKKSKDRKYLKENLLDHGPGMYRKAYDDGSNSDPRGSGRFFKTVSGEWIFSEDEEYNAPTEETFLHDHQPGDTGLISVQVDQVGNTWTIVDKDERRLIIKEGQTLTIYEELLPGE